MGTRIIFPLAALAAVATATVPDITSSKASASELEAYLQCVPYARQVSGIGIYGDAHTWWGQAEGRYERGRTPKVGAVMYFPRSERMRYGHVAAVSKILGPRRVLLNHANWSPINGRRGQIERDVLARDVSPNNDWSEVRVWYAPLDNLGSTRWKVEGFIYPDAASNARQTNWAQIEAQPDPTPPRLPAAVVVPAPRMAPARAQSSAGFTAAFSDLDTPANARQVRPVRAQPVRRASTQRGVPSRPSANAAIRSALSRYE